jgi:hypothetical protein
MAKKKDSNAKKVGRFVANELLGVDDMRRVVKYVRQGDFKKAAKSAGAAAAEIGTTVVPVAAGAKVGKVASKVLPKSAKAIQTTVRGKRTYYHGSPNEIPVGSTLKTKAQGSKLAANAGKASATSSKKVAKSYATGRLTMVDGKIKQGSGYIYKVKSKSGDVAKTAGRGAKEFAAKDFVVVKKVKQVKKK